MLEVLDVGATAPKNGENSGITIFAAFVKTPAFVKRVITGGNDKLQPSH